MGNRQCSEHSPEQVKNTNQNSADEDNSNNNSPRSNSSQSLKKKEKMGKSSRRPSGPKRSKLAPKKRSTHSRSSFSHGKSKSGLGHRSRPLNIIYRAQSTHSKSSFGRTKPKNSLGYGPGPQSRFSHTKLTHSRKGYGRTKPRNDSDPEVRPWKGFKRRKTVNVAAPGYVGTQGCGCLNIFRGRARQPQDNVQKQYEDYYYPPMTEYKITPPSQDTPQTIYVPVIKENSNTLTVTPRRNYKPPVVNVNPATISDPPTIYPDYKYPPTATKRRPSGHNSIYNHPSDNPIFT